MVYACILIEPGSVMCVIITYTRIHKGNYERINESPTVNADDIVPFSLKTWEDKSILAAITVYIRFPVERKHQDRTGACNHRIGPERTGSDVITGSDLFFH